MLPLYVKIIKSSPLNFTQYAMLPHNIEIIL